MTSPVRIGQRRHQGSGPGPPWPRQDPAVPQSKNSATTVPCPATSTPACSRCRAREVTGSCQSSVETRP
ncbi:MAG TPA: hypothetical protein VGS06_14810 [Streptosporangiaceae bacterium]|nr:hypothetical protein [Streptosporangiaceae bacterium]